MAPKRPLEDDAAVSLPKKQRAGFKVGPDNLPDGTYRRKGTIANPLKLRMNSNIVHSDQDQEELDPKSQSQEILRQTQSPRTHCSILHTH